MIGFTNEWMNSNQVWADSAITLATNEAWNFNEYDSLITEISALQTISLANFKIALPHSISSIMENQNKLITTPINKLINQNFLVSKIFLLASAVILAILLSFFLMNSF